MPKNYYLYIKDGKVKRQTINMNDIYPESYAYSKIPSECDIFGRVETKGGIQFGFWQKHDLYPKNWEDPIEMEIWNKNQEEYKKAHYELLNKQEKLIFKL